MTISARNAEAGLTPSPSAPGSGEDRALVWIQHEVGIQILHDVAKRCREASIRFLAVKGIATSRLLYADVADRPIGDVDIRVRPEDVRAFERMGLRAAWRCVRVLRSYGSLIYDFGALSLDVESTVGPPGLCGLAVDAMLARAEPRELAPGLCVAVPEIHDHAVLLVVNVFKDKIVTATSWGLGDLERVVRHPEFRRDVFVDRVRGARITTMTWVVAAWMESAREDLAWGEVREALEGRGGVRWRYAGLVRRGLKGAVGRAPLSLRLLARVASDSPRMQVEALARAAACVVELPLRRISGRS
jgi:hypothetical protein